MKKLSKKNRKPVHKLLKTQIRKVKVNRKKDEMIKGQAGPSKNKKVIILGGGPNRIGQGIEFDYCCCHAAYALKEEGVDSIMVNCNPETVSTD